MAPKKTESWAQWKPGREAFKRILQFESSKIWFECTECGARYRAAGSCACPVCGMCYPARALGEVSESEMPLRTHSKRRSLRMVK